MRITDQSTDETILAEVGSRLAQIRLNKNLTQAQLAEQAGVSKRTIERLETGGAATQLSGFIRVCRVLGLVERLDLLVPEPAPSPIELLRLRGRRRRRASAGRRTKASPGKWQWGPES